MELDRLRPFLPPLPYQALLFRRRLGYFPNLMNPKTFNEKIFWRKFREDMSYAPALVDKVAVREYVAATVGPDYLVPVLQVVARAEDLDVRALPDSYIIKANHGSGWNQVVRLGEVPDIPRFANYLARHYGDFAHEHWYARIRPQVLVEELLTDDEYGTPLDYKFFVFHGRAHFVQVDFDRFTAHQRTFFDMKWQPMPFRLLYQQGRVIRRPSRLGQMAAVSEELAGNLEFVRVDLFCVNDQEVKFGELTLSPEAGLGRFRPASADRMLGDLWDVGCA